MIYVARDGAADIRQGDIFVDVPFFEVRLDARSFAVGEDEEPLTWAEAVARRSGADPPDIATFVAVRPSVAMVLSQDCDVARDNGSVLLGLVDEFRLIHRDLGTATSPDKLQKHITKLSKIALKWFYLPAAPEVHPVLGLKNAADFQTTTRVSVRDLRTLHRVAGLNDVAREHLRHRIAYYFQRYPVDEWYALDAEELAQYRKSHPEAEPFAWQQPVARPEE